MELYPQEGQPTFRSIVDWTTIAQEAANDSSSDSEDRPITRVRANEVVLQAGDLLYLPTYWFHYMVSLNTNYQCQASSGTSFEHEEHIIDCGFGLDEGEALEE